MEPTQALEQAPRRRRRLVPWGLAGTLALIALIEGFIDRRAPLFDQDYAPEWRFTANAAADQATRSKILCFGDSLVKTGVAPVVLEWELGLPAFNLALSGGQLPSAYFMLERALEAGANPELIVLDCKWTALALDYTANNRLIPEVFGPEKYFELAREAGDVGLFSNLMLARYSTAFRARREIRDGVLKALDGDTRPVAHSVPLLERNWTVNNGGGHPHPNPEFFGDVDHFDKRLFNTKWKPEHVNIAFFERFLKLARRRKIPVALVMMPLAPQTQSYRDELGLDEEYRALLRIAVERFDNVTVIDGRFSGYDETAFVDATHFNDKGASIFTSQLARAIRPILAGRISEKKEDRWVSMPKVDPNRRSWMALESVHDSAVAIDWVPLPKRR